MPKVSVIMPVYNGDRFVEKAIESILLQDYPDWEAVVVNDGSTDDTAAVLASITDSRVRVITQANGGESSARNRGLDVISGKFVAFLDADDIYLPNALGDMVAYLDAHEEMDAVCSDGYFCDTNDQLLGRMSEVRPRIQPGNVLDELVIDATVIGPPAFVMIRSSNIAEAQARFDPNLVIGPDWDFWIQIARAARFGYLDKPTCMYRIHATNITRTTSSKRRTADLVLGRRKVMESAWFSDLSLETRKRFFYNLLVELLGEQPDEQRSVMAGASFQALAPSARAYLLRLVASAHLLNSREVTFATDCLRQSLLLQPSNGRARVLLMLTATSPHLSSVFLSYWRLSRERARRLTAITAPRSPRLPANLAPKDGPAD